MLHRRLALAAFLLGLVSQANAQVATPAVNTSTPPAPTMCANATIPGANTIGSTNVETAFNTVCTIKASQLIAASVLHLHVGGVYKAGTAETATGRVRINQSGTLNLVSDTTVINTGALNGIAGATAGSEWWGDVFITFQTGATSIDVQGMLIFQAATSVLVPVGNAVTFTVDPTKDLTFYLTVQWGSTSANNSMQLRTMVAK